MYIPTGNDVRETRKAHGLTQGEVAERADISQPLLSRIENDDVDPRLSTLHRIAEAINDTGRSIEEEDLVVAVPSAIKQIRIDVSLTQAELARRAGVSQPLIARIENDEVNPRASTLRAILNELDTGTVASATKSSGQVDKQSETDILASIKDSFDEFRE